MRSKETPPGFARSVLCRDKHRFVQPFLPFPNPRMLSPAVEGVQPLESPTDSPKGRARSFALHPLWQG